MNKHPIDQWLKFFGVSVIDWDGFAEYRANRWPEPIGFQEFAEGICECTIQVDNSERYQNFKFLIG